MTEDEARDLLLVRAVELNDLAEMTLTAEDQRLATAAGLSAQSENRRAPSREQEDEVFLVKRSAFASARIVTRSPVLARAANGVRWPSWIGWSAPLGALAIGVVTNEIDNGQRLNIIAFPLMGMLAWNLAVYAWLAAGWLRGLRHAAPERHEAGFGARLLSWSAKRRSRDDSSAGLAVTRFVDDWLTASAPLTQVRSTRTLHLAAAALAAGVVLGMYGRALGLEYRAGWESTFIDAATLARIVEIVLGPASALTGLTLPEAAELEALRWRPGKLGENAGRWIHLYATTAAIFIIGPRLLLATWNAAKAWSLRRRFPVPGREDFYVRRLLREARDDGTVVRVIPFSFHLHQEAEQRLRRLLTGVLGDRTRVATDAPIAYGTEEVWLASAAIDPETDHVLALFNLSATPEAETHGAFLTALQRRIAECHSGASLTAVVDDSAYRLRLAGQAGSGQRLETRRLAWDTVLQRAGAVPLIIDLSEVDEFALIQRVEGALMGGPALISEGPAA